MPASTVVLGNVHSKNNYLSPLRELLEIQNSPNGDLREPPENPRSLRGHHLRLLEAPKHPF
jgi:hypothetical protein